MKAQLVYNTNEEPRILLELETAEERKLFESEPDLELVRTGYSDGVFTDVAFAIKPVEES